MKRKSAAANLMMTTLSVVTVALFAFFSTVRCQTVLFPSRLHLGEKNTLLVLSNDDPTNSITTTSSATLELFSKESPSIPLLSQPIQFTQGQLTEASFSFEPNGGNFPPAQAEDIIVVVTFPNGVTRSALVEVSPENGFIYLQTDKPIYKVEDTVRFRVLRLDRHLRPLSEHVLLRISNHQKIKVEEAALVTGPPMHIAEHRFNFPLIAKPGTWTADVLYGPKHKLVASTAFDVTQYILPAFKIDFTLPKFIFSTDTSVDIVMNVSYTFGKPVRGTVYYRYGITEVGGAPAAAEDGNKVGGDKAVASAPVINFFNSTNTFCFDGGVMRHQADISWIREHGGQYLKGSGRAPLRFVVEATVRECATNTQEQSLDSSVAIVERPYSFGFGRTVRRYKPMVVNYLAFEVLDPHGKPAPEVPFSLKITSTETRNPVTLEHSIVSAENGFVVFSFLPPDNFRSYKVQLATTVEHFDPSQQTYASFILEPFRQTGIKKSSQLVDASLWIANKRGFSFQVGERFQSEVLAERLQGDTAYLLVMSRGAVVQWEKISLQSSKHINLLISNQMVPSVRLLLVATSEDGELLADSHRLTVSPGANCGGSLNVQLLKAGQQNQRTKKRRKVYPGGNVTFQVEGGHRGDVLGFHAIDEAVYILRRGAENASLSSYSALLERADGGCGPGGAAANSAEVLRSAGFKVLSSSSVIDEQQFGVFSCAKNRKKKARRVRKESGDDAKKTTNSSTLEEAFRLWCCHLGEVKPSKGSSEDLGCMDRSKIVERYTSRACKNEYLACCLRSTRNEFQASRDSASSSSSSSSNADSGNPSVESDDFIDSGGVTVEHVRSDFRDTWLFDLVLLNQSGTQNITFTTPDSITNWAVRTLSITSREGFCLASGDPIASVTTFKPFFLEVRLPPTVVEHEQAEVQVTAFNYQSTGTTLNVTFERVKGLCSDWLRAPRATRELFIAPHSFAQTAFSLLPVKSGRFNVSIEAKSLLKGSDGFVDKVVKKLTVLAPGVVKEQQLTFDLDPQNRARREARIETGLYVDETTGNEQKTRVKLRPKRGAGADADDDESAMKNLGLDVRYITSDSSASSNIVPDSLRYVVTAFGERYRPQLSSIEELSELIRKPKGCGEQNMYYAAFNLYSMVYLEQLGRLELATRTKGVGYLKRALVQQLEFRKEDGSFATFRKRPASVWLTAFVAKTFCQAAPYLGDQLLDEQIVVTAIAWLQGRQKLDQPKPSDNGHFQEEHPVLHEKAMGGAKGRVPLTAYILTVLNQCRPYLEQIFTSSSAPEEVMASLNETIEQAETFVLANYQEVGDRSQAYRQALVAYALSYSESSEAAVLKEKLVQALTSSASHDSKLNQKSWKDSAAWPVETAAYALLALITSGPPNGPKGAYQQQVDLLGHPMSIANWLNAQQMKGAFDNTQDTIVALDALSKFYLLNKVNQEFEQEEQEEVVMAGGGRSRNRKRNGLQTDVLFDEQLKRSLSFNHSNADLLQTLPVDSETREISFKTTGNGLGKLSLLIIYNEFAPNGTNCRFDIDVDAYQYREQPIVHESHIEGRYFPSREKSKAKLYGELGITGNRTQRSMKEEANRRYLHASIGKQTSEATNVQSCCEDTRLAARRKRRNAAVNSSKKEGGKGVDKELQSRRKRANHRLGLLPPLPVTSTRKPQVMVLSLCVRYHSVSEYQSDMAILEVGLLSGFRPVTRDLDLVLAEETYVVQYDVTTTKVVLYLRTVPTGRQYCFQFRLYQKYKVKKVQPALIRMYNYYEEEWTCTRFYSQTRVTAYMDYQCGGSSGSSKGNKDSPSWFSKNFVSTGSEDAEGSSCRCVTQERCPGRTDVDNARRADGTLEDMRKLFCSFSHILIGTVQWVGNETFATEGGAGEKDSVVPVMDIRVDRKDQSAGVIFGQLKPTGKNRQLYQPTIRLYFHSECRYFVEAYSQSVGSRVLVMHSPVSRDPRWLVNGNSMLKVLDKDGYEEMKRYQSTLLSEDNCPKLNENT